MQPRRAWRRQKRGGAAQGGRTARRVALPSRHCCPCPRRLRRNPLRKPWRSWRKSPEYCRSESTQGPARLCLESSFLVQWRSVQTRGYVLSPHPARFLSLLSPCWRDREAGPSQRSGFAGPLQCTGTRPGPTCRWRESAYRSGSQMELWKQFLNEQKYKTWGLSHIARNK